MIRSMIRCGLLVALALTTAAHADTRVNVTSNAPARVFLDGQLVGQAPLQLARIGGGRHIVRVDRIGSPENRDFVIMSPRGRRVTIQQVDARFAHHRRPVIVQPVQVVQPVTYVQQPVVVAQQAPVVVRQPIVVDRSAQIQHQKTVTRNTLLGAAVVNEVFNKGNSKGLLRGVTLGGALLNEVAR